MHVHGHVHVHVHVLAHVFVNFYLIFTFCFDFGTPFPVSEISMKIFFKFSFTVMLIVPAPSIASIAFLQIFSIKISLRRKN